MINYSAIPPGINIAFQQYFLPVTALIAGTNSFQFASNSVFSVGKNLYAEKIDQGFNCCPWQFIVYNLNTTDLTSTFFSNGGQDFNSTVDCETMRWTLIMPLDKSKVNHQHLDQLNGYLEMRFAIGVPDNDIYIYVLFSYFNVI